MTEQEAPEVSVRRGRYWTEEKEIPVVFDFDRNLPQGKATFDTSTGELLMRIRRGSKLFRVLAGSDEKGVVVGFAFRPFDPAIDEIEEGSKGD
jgi:hypothetical protein